MDISLEFIIANSLIYFLFTIAAILLIVAAITHKNNQKTLRFIQRQNNKKQIKASKQTISKDCTIDNTLAPYDATALNLEAINALKRYPIPIYLCSSQIGRIGLFYENTEAIFYQHAKRWAAENNYELLSKVRIADILSVPTDNNYKSNITVFRSIANKHFDFVFFQPITLYNGECNLIPKLIIEIDGLSHNSQERRERDTMVDILVSKYNSIPQAKNKLTILHIHMQDISNPDSLWEIIRCIQAGNKQLEATWNPIDAILSTYIY